MLFSLINYGHIFYYNVGVQVVIFSLIMTSYYYIHIYKQIVTSERVRRAFLLFCLLSSTNWQLYNITVGHVLAHLSDGSLNGW